MVSSFERLFGTKPNLKVTSPLDKGDHPEFDTSELLDNDGIQQYQSLIGALQWAISIGQFDISTAVMTLSSFCVAPRHGHLASYISSIKLQLSGIPKSKQQLKLLPPVLNYGCLHNKPFLTNKPF
jgi:hypothetical protein